MRIQMRLVAISALCVLLLGGCPVVTETPPPSPFPAGVYSGPTTFEGTDALNGVVFDSSTGDAGVRTIVIDEQGRQEVDGLLLGPGILARIEVGGAVIERAITDVTVSADVILTSYAATLVFDGVEFSGSGSWTYKLRDDGDIDYNESMIAGRTIDGDLHTIKLRASGVLSRL